ncbi:Uncharacterised protein [Vibrio cholerae]|nr:Uncharacterised protein [Vibrio cholerae]
MAQEHILKRYDFTLQHFDCHIRERSRQIAQNQ